MKKYIILLGVVAIAMASCSVKEESPILSDGSHLMLTGESYNGTKVSIGEKNGETYPLLWFTGDMISINSIDASAEGAVSGELAELYDGSGSSSGVFRTINELVPESDMDVMILYPGNTMTYSDGMITGSVQNIQNQRSANSSVHVGANCFSYGETTILADQTTGVKFNLTQKTAFVKVVITSDEYADYDLTDFTLSADESALSGDFTYDMVNDRFIMDTEHRDVGVSIINASSLSSSQEVYFTAIPCDLTDETVYAVATVDDGNESMSLTAFIENPGALKAGCLTIIEFNVDESSLKWYTSNDPRDMLNKWAYGAQNTYFIEQPETGSGHINFDVRGRGDISNLVEPKYYGMWTRSSEGSKADLVYLLDKDGNEVTDHTLIPVNDNYTIDVYCYNQSAGEGRWAVVALFDENEEVIWSFMIWKYLEGDEPQSVRYSSDIELLDRTIGYPYSNKLAEKNGTFNGPGAFFQWGRKDPFPWSKINQDKYDMYPNDEGSDLSTGIKNPGYMYCSTSTPYWWQDLEKDRTDLWGCSYAAESEYSDHVGHKTIYDPCPEGYRVCDSRVFWLVDAGEHWDAPDSGVSSFQEEKGWLNPSSPFYDAGESCMAVSVSSGYDYWLYGGTFWGYDDQGLGDPSAEWWNKASNTKTRFMAYSSNRMASIPNYRSLVDQKGYWGTSGYAETENNELYKPNSIRCQKED